MTEMSSSRKSKEDDYYSFVDLDEDQTDESEPLVAKSNEKKKQWVRYRTFRIFGTFGVSSDAFC